MTSTLKSKYKTKKLKGDLIERIDAALALEALADPHYVEEVIVDRPINHRKIYPHFEVKKTVGNIVKAAVYAREGCGYLVNLVIRGAHGLKNIGHYIHDLNRDRDKYFPSVV